MMDWKVFAIEVADGQGKKVVDRLASRAQKLKMPVRGVLYVPKAETMMLIESTKRVEVVKLVRGVKGVTNVLGGKKAKVLAEAYKDKDLHSFAAEDTHYLEVKQDDD